MNTFIKLILELTEKYQSEYDNTIQDQEFRNRIERELKKEITNIIPLPFTADASLGTGNWAKVPWVAIFHPTITSSAQKGFYVVYLINTKLKTISLSLNQGVTEIEHAFGTGKHAKREMLTRAEMLIKRAGKLPKELSIKPISLSASGKLGPKYEIGHAFGRTYSLKNFDTKSFSTDFHNILYIYKKLVTENGYDTFENLDGDFKDRTVKEKKRIALHYRLDRVGNASKKVKKAKGYICEACDFDFLKFYGEIGKNYIEAHHLISFEKLDINQERELDVIDDFAVLCANCHRMIHRQEDPSDLDALKAAIKQSKSKISARD